MSQPPIVLKGSNFTLSVLHLNNTDQEMIRQALCEKIRQAPAFLTNAPIVLNIENLPVDFDLSSIKASIESTGVHIVGISGCKHEIHKQWVSQVNLPLLTEGKTAALDIATINNHQAMVISKPVRTGQQIYSRGGDLIVTTDVSAGAELIADGNIHIYGTMRGRALAGANGNEYSHIFCTQLAAELVSIAGQYWLSEQIPAEYFEKPAQLSIKNNALTIQYLR